MVSVTQRNRLKIVWKQKIIQVFMSVERFTEKRINCLEA